MTIAKLSVFETAVNFQIENAFRAQRINALEW
jgi:hypothetical protein